MSISAGSRSPSPIIIRGSGATYVFTNSISAIVTGLFLFDAAKRGTTPGMVLLWLTCAAGFAVFFLRILTARVVLDKDWIMYRGWFRTKRSLTLDQVAVVRLITRRGYRIDFHYLVLKPRAVGAPILRIRTDLFSHADVQTMRSFLGEKLRTARSAQNFKE